MKSIISELKIIHLLVLSILLPCQIACQTTTHKQASEKNSYGDIENINTGNSKINQLLSEGLNPNENPDKVIALLEPYKDNENNNNFIFYSNLGLAYKSKGRLDDAITAYKHAVALAPGEPEIQYNLAIAYFNNNELFKALNHLLISAEKRPDHSGTKRWIDHLTGELDICKVPDTSKMKLVFDKNINVDRQDSDKESRLRIFFTGNGGRIQVLSVGDKIYSYGFDSDTEAPVDYIIIDNDGDGNFESIINSKSKFGIPTWAYKPE